MRKQWLLFLLGLFIFSSAHAAGIAPAKISLSLAPGQTYDITYYAVNDLDREIFVEAYASGELANFIEIAEKNILLKPKEIKPFSITLTMPSDFKQKYVSYIGVAPASSISNSGLSARVVAESLLEITTLLNKPVLQLELNVLEQRPVLLQLTIKNPSTVSVEKIVGNIKISDRDFAELTSFEVKESKLLPSRVKQRDFEWSPTSDGEFVAFASLNFNGGSATIDKAFKVGRQILEIVNVSIDKKDNIVEIAIEVENKWNVAIEAWAEIFVLDSGNKTETLKTQTLEIPAGKTEVLKAYWETERNPENFDFDILVHYGDFTVQKKILAKKQASALSTTQLQTALSKLTGAFSVLGKLKSNIFAAALTLIFIIAIFISLFVYSRRKPPKPSYEDYYREYYKRYYDYLSRLKK